MRKVPTQAERVVDYIIHFGSITRAEALMDLGIANLPAVIDVLRNKKGYPVITEEVKGMNRYEQAITFARYHIDWTYGGKLSGN
jgi:hypothetical protein